MGSGLISPTRSLTSDNSRTQTRRSSISNRSGSRASNQGEYFFFCLFYYYNSIISLGESQILFGVTNIQIVRLKGEVFNVEAIHSILERKHFNGNISAVSPATSLNGFICSPNKTLFIPPVGHEVDINSKKAKLNISFIKNRDEELRSVSETIINNLFRNVLSTNSSRDYFIETVTGLNSKEVQSGKENDKKSVLSLSNYGVFFSEIKKVKPLNYRLILEIKYLGYSNYLSSEKEKIDELIISTSGVPLQVIFLPFYFNYDLLSLIVDIFQNQFIDGR
jgi:hypothetical protein